MRIEFHILGEEVFAREILRVGDRGADARPAFELIADLWGDWEAEQFASEGRRASGGWDQLAPSTIRSKGSPGPILFESGDLFRELTSRENILITDSFMHLTIDPEVEEYARFHQSGTDKMPQRRPLEFTDLDRRHMIKVVQQWVINGTLPS